MRPRTYLVRLTFAACFAGGLASSAIAQQGRVGGVVRDDKGNPIKGATIVAENSDFGTSFSASSDDKGRFSMVGLRTGLWQFTAQAPAHEPKGGMLRVRVGAPNPPITFELNRIGPEAVGALASIVARNLQADLAAADLLFNQQKWDEAVAAYRAIMKQMPTLSAINLQIGAAYRSKKDFDAALEAYRALLSTEPDNEKAAVGIAFTNLERGDPNAAEATLRRAAENPNVGRDILFSLGEVKASVGSIDEAVSWYEKASATDLSWGKPLHRLGMLALQKGDTAAAVRHLEQVISVDPNSAEAALARTALDQLNK